MLQEMGRSIQSLRDPKGTKEAPARTCKDLAARHPDYESGMVSFLYFVTVFIAAVIWYIGLA